MAYKVRNGSKTKYKKSVNANLTFRLGNGRRVRMK